MLDDRSTMHLYGGAIGVVSGTYSLVPGMNMMNAMPLLSSLIGLAALAHGILLFTAHADRIDRYNGPLMVAYAAGMLLVSSTAWMQPMREMTGMVPLALLMLVSGLIMMDRYEAM